MNIGVFFSNTSPTSGGGFQYEINIAKLLKEKSGKNSDPEQIFRGLGRTGGIILSSGVLRSKRMLTKENLQ